MKKMMLLLFLTLSVMIIPGCDRIEDFVPPQTTKNTEPVATAAPEATAAPTAVPIQALDFSKYSTVDNKGSGWGFKKIKGTEPEIFEATKKMLASYDTYYMDQRKPKALYLTFDEGYENGYTADILDTLKKCGVPAAFFVTGPYLKEQNALIERMITEGHIVGNHTVNHPNLPRLAEAEKMASELTQLNECSEELYGYTMRYMRPPEGEYSERLLSVAQDLGYKTIFWSFAYKDWDPKLQKGTDYAYNQVTSYMHDGAILLLHAVSKDNAAALENIITYAKDQGYEFRSLDELE